MSTKSAAESERAEPRVQPVGVVGPAPSRPDGVRLVALGVVTLVSGAFLVVMFISLAQGRSASPWGPINDLLGAAGNVLLAGLIPRLSRGAAQTGRTRGFVWLVAGASVAGAVSGVLLVARFLAFEPSTAISMVAIVLQAVWMTWLSRAWSRDPQVPRSIWRMGAGVGLGLLTGIGLVGASFLFQWGSVAANALLIPGVVIGGVMWLAWPLWFVLLGCHLYRAAAADLAESTDA